MELVERVLAYGQSQPMIVTERSQRSFARRSFLGEACQPDLCHPNRTPGASGRPAERRRGPIPPEPRFARQPGAGAIRTGRQRPQDGYWKFIGQLSRIGGGRTGAFVGSVDGLTVDEASRPLVIGGTFTAADTVETSGVATLKDDTFGNLGAFPRFGDAGNPVVFARAVTYRMNLGLAAAPSAGCPSR